MFEMFSSSMVKGFHAGFGVEHMLVMSIFAVAYIYINHCMHHHVN